eukprot:1907353-Amphidinium_carterae.1
MDENGSLGGYGDTYYLLFPSILWFGDLRVFEPAQSSTSQRRTVWVLPARLARGTQVPASLCPALLPETGHQTA